jgi:hypothetical protein
VSYELREREGLDGSEPSPPFLVPDDRLDLPGVLHIAGRAGRTVDVYESGRYMVTYCGASPYWWLPRTAGGEMHQIGSHGWCHNCHKAGAGYVHHLAYDDEVAALTTEARDDPVLREQCEADGLTPGQYAAEVAGRAVPLDGDRSFVIGVHELGVNIDGQAEFAIDMWDMTTWKIAVEVAEGAPDTAQRLAEELAVAQSPKRCVHCHGTRGHSRTCMVTREAELLAQYPHLRLAGKD